MNTYNTMDLLIVDLEATCWPRKEHRMHQMEIIEIGAVLFDRKTKEINREFQSFVKPILRPILSDFCTELTSIRQDDIEGASHFPEVLARLQKEILDPHQVIFASWGIYDKKQLQQDCQLHHIKFPFSDEHLNLKKLFAQKMNVRKCGMKKAMALLNLDLNGTHHRGIDDARNIAKIFRVIDV